MPTRRMLTLVLAIVIGGGLAWWGAPRWIDARALTGIADPDAGVRRAAWARLLGPAPDAPVRRADRLMERIARILSAAPEPALLDGATALRAADRWGWGRLPPDLVLREAHLRAGGDETSRTLATEALRDAPFDLDGPRVIAIAARLLERGPPAAREEALGVVAEWAGRARGPLLSRLPAADDPGVERARRLVLAVCTPPIADAAPAAAPPAVREAALLGVARAGPPSSGVLLDALEGGGPDAIAVDYLLRQCADPRAEAILTTRAEAGHRSALFALDARRPERDAARAARLLDDVDAPWARRMLAAWRLPDAPPPRVRALLAERVTDEDGHVYAAALLAARRLPADDAGARAERWIRSFDDDEKRAGALLAALLGGHADLLADAHARENVGRVRTVQRIALGALGRRVGPDDPGEFVHRALGGSGGTLDPDLALAALAAGHADVLALVTAVPPVRPSAIQARAWLIEHFVPHWHAVLGRPVGGDAGGLRLHFDALDALRRLDARRLEFDRSSRRFLPAGAGRDHVGR